MKKIILVLGLVSYLLSACTNNEFEEINYEIDKRIEKDFEIISLLGFDTTNIVINTTNYIVEGDIILQKDQLGNYLSPITKQAYRREGIVSDSKVRNIKVRIHNSVANNQNGAQLITAINNSLNYWNSISLSYINFSLVNANEDIIITMYSNSSINAAMAYFPLNGNPEDSILINENYNFTSVSNIAYNITHEMGHCLGL